MEGKVRSWVRVVASVLVAFTVASVPAVGQEVKKSVPNIFTPNGDGINDRITLESKETMVFVVYNREGGVVFRAEGRQIIFDGLNERGQKISDGIYYYILKDPADGYASNKGFIYLSTDKNTGGGRGE